MDKELFRKIEGQLYRYYYDIEELRRVKAEIKYINNIIDNLERKIKECSVKIDPYQSGGYVEERVHTSIDCTSYVEKEITRAIEDMIREQAHMIRKLFKLECRERNLSYKIENMRSNIDMLKPEYKKFIELKYNQVKYNLGMRDIAIELNMGKNKAYDLREKLINNIARFNKNWGTK